MSYARQFHLPSLSNNSSLTNPGLDSNSEHVSIKRLSSSALSTSLLYSAYSFLSLVKLVALTYQCKVCLY